MELYGYDGEKLITPVTMSPAQIVELGIDPFRLDLFDADPIRVHVGRLTCDRAFLTAIELRFTRLMQLSFAYALGDHGYIGVFDGKERKCYSGAIADCFGGHMLALSHLSPDAKSFDHHLKRYLELAFPLNGLGKPCFSVLHGGGHAFKPGAADNIVVRQGQIVYEEPKYQSRKSETVVATSVQFAGRMYEALAVRKELPENMNWVFDAFAEWQPAVVSDAVFDALNGRSSSELGLVLTLEDDFRLSLVERRSRELGAEWLPNIHSLRRAGTTYKLDPRLPTDRPDYWHNCVHTVMQMAATARDTVQLSRIALHDLGRKWLRDGVGEIDPQGRRRRHRLVDLLEADHLRAQGFTPVQTQLGYTDHGLDGMRRIIS